MDSDVERTGGGGNQQNEEYSSCTDTTSSGSSESDSPAPARKPCRKCTQRRRKRPFKRYNDRERYETGSYVDEGRLKPPNVKKAPKGQLPKYGPPNLRWPNVPLRWDDEARYQRRMEFEHRPGYSSRGQRRRSQLPLKSFFMEKWLEEYLGGPIKPYKPITSSRDKVELEPLDSDVFLPLKPYKPILFEIESPSGQITTVQRVWGYREIMQKRARIEQLRWIEAEQKLGQRLTCCPSSPPSNPTRIPKKVRRRAKQSGIDLKESSDEVLLGETSTPGISIPTSIEVKGQTGSKDDESIFSQRSKGNWNDSNSSTCSLPNPFVEDFLRFQNPAQLILVGGGPDPADDHDHDHGDSDSDENSDEDGGATPKKAKERDNEWLMLSSSDSEEVMFQYEKVGKSLKPWMQPGVSYESQNFGKVLQGFICLLCLCCRLPIMRRTDTIIGLLLFSVSRFNILPFLFVSCLLWVIAVIIAESIIDVLYGSDDGKFLVLEGAEMGKYKCAIMGMCVNLFFVAIWSIAVILRDGYHTCQYMNFLVASLTKFEISGTRRLRRTVVKNMLIATSYCAVLGASFYYDFPKTTRGSCRFFAQLLCRPFLYRLRKLAHDDEQLKQYLELGGLGLNLFCYISLRFVFTHMHLLAVVLGNLAKNWNFRFGLCFAQFGSANRAHLYRIHAGQSLIKLFSEHRLVSGLTRFYGSVFAIPIITYYILQIALVSTVTIIMFFEGYTTTDVLQYVEIPGTGANITLNTTFENAVTSGFVLGHFIFEFVLVSELISSACSPVRSGFEFVRRQGLMRCQNTHEVRLIMSLQWSMSAKNPALVNVNDFFYVNRPGILSSLGFSLLIVSLVIQLKQTTLVTLILKCTENINYTPSYNFESCHEIKLVSGPDAPLHIATNEEDIKRIING